MMRWRDRAHLTCPPYALNMRLHHEEQPGILHDSCREEKKHRHSTVNSHSVIFIPAAGKEEKGSRRESKKRVEEKREIMRGYEMRGEKERWSRLWLPLAGCLSSALLNVLNWQGGVNRQLPWPLSSERKRQSWVAGGALCPILLRWKALSSCLSGTRPELPHKDLSNHCRLSASNGNPRVGFFASMSQEGGREIQINK